MDNNTKSLLKNTIMGLVGGGALSALYALRKNKEDEDAAKRSDKDEITVPLSKKNYLRSVGKKEKATEKAPERDVSKMTPQDLAALKKELLRKRASVLPTKIEEKTGPASSNSIVRKAKKANYATLRNGKGQFSTEKNLAKTAGVMSGITDDAKGTMLDAVGSAGGFFVGMAAVKHIADRIMVNRKKKQLEKSRKTYVDMLNREVNDEDTPYYKKADDRGLVGRSLGLLGLAGAGTAGVAGLVVYRIMENRRKEEEKALDKDMSRFPAEKTIKYKFASAKGQKGKRDFFA